MGNMDVKINQRALSPGGFGLVYTFHHIFQCFLMLDFLKPQIRDVFIPKSITEMARDMVRNSYFITIKLPTDRTSHRFRGLKDILFFFPCIHRDLLAIPPTTLPILPGLPTCDVRIQADMLRGKPRLRVGRPCSQWGHWRRCRCRCRCSCSWQLRPCHGLNPANATIREAHFDATRVVSTR